MRKGTASSSEGRAVRVKHKGEGRHMTDIAGSLTTTHREVGSRRIATGEARTALMRRRYDAPIEDVWDACTDPGLQDLL